MSSMNYDFSWHFSSAPNFLFFLAFLASCIAADVLCKTKEWQNKVSLGLSRTSFCEYNVSVTISGN